MIPVVTFGSHAAIRELLPLVRGERYRKLFAASKRQEKQKFEAIITTFEYETYLRDIQRRSRT